VQLQLSSSTPRKARATIPPRGSAVAAHPSSVPAPKVQHMARHRGATMAAAGEGCSLLCASSMSPSQAGSRGWLPWGHSGNLKPRSHHGRSWRRGWYHPGSTGTSPPAIGQDELVLPAASKCRLSSFLIRRRPPQHLLWRRPPRHHAWIRPPAHPAGKLGSSAGRSRVPELRAPSKLLRH